MKIISLYNPINCFTILYPTSLANLVVEVGTRHSPQILFNVQFCMITWSLIFASCYTIDVHTFIEQGIATEKLGNGRVITYHTFVYVWLIIHAFNSVLV